MVTVDPIRTEGNYTAAMTEIDCLLRAAPGERDEDRLDVLTALVHAYEQQHHRAAIGTVDPITLLRFVMEQRGLSRADLEPMIGGRGRISEALNRKRPLTLDMIRRLSQALDIPADLLVAEYALDRGAA